MAQVLPVVVEQKLDGSLLGLSSNLSSDAFTFSEPMVIDDIKNAAGDTV